MPSEIFDTLGLYPEEILAWSEKSQGNIAGLKSKLSRMTTQNKMPHLDGAIGAALWHCTNILSKSGFLSRMQFINSAQLGEDDVRRRLLEIKKWDFVITRLCTDPVAMKNKAIWLFFQAIWQAQRDFALDLCPPRSNETYLRAHPERN